MTTNLTALLAAPARIAADRPAVEAPAVPAPALFTLRLDPLCTPSGSIVPNGRAVVREDTGAALAAVGGRYTICQPAEALERIASRNSQAGAESDAFEKGPFLNDVRGIYRKMADETFVIIDAAGSREQILSQILDDLDRNFTDAE